MIIFKTIRWRNFLSTGNNFTEVNFLDAKTNLIVGINGSGKSTILDALTFVLYNKPFRKINKPQLVNSVNEKDCLVEIEFSIGSREYKVVRGIKPNIFEIWVDGNKENVDSSSNDQQKRLEENILKLNYKSFTQTVILGSATFVPFMQLSSANRREIVEDLLDIKIFSTMNNLIKDRIRKTNETVREYSIKKDMVEDKIEMQKNFISDLDKSGKERIQQRKQKISEVKTQCELLEQENKIKYQEIELELKPKLSELSSAKNTLKKYNRVKAQLEQKLQGLVDDYKFFEVNDTCPTCTQKIGSDFKNHKVVEIENKSNEIQKASVELEQLIKTEQEKEESYLKITQEINDCNSKISVNNARISSHNRLISDYIEEIEQITNQIENRNEEKEKLKELLDDLESILTSISEEKKNTVYYDFIHNLMKDGGVKSKIIKKYLPLMNQQINKYLQLMDFYINFTLDEEFKEVIKSPIHEDFSYESFSEGEKMRIDLALLFTWRDIARLRNSASTNLLILDEIFDSSLDGAGTDFFTSIIRYVINDANIFVISHKTDDLIDKFERIIKFDKVKGFSKMM